MIILDFRTKMLQSSYVILVIFAVTLISITQAIPSQPTCLKDGNKVIHLYL